MRTLALFLVACSTGGGYQYSPAEVERVSWIGNGPVSTASVLEGVFEFNAVVPNDISTFEAYGAKPNQSGTGLTFVFQDADPETAPTRADGISIAFAIHGAARVYQRQVLVGDQTVAGQHRGRVFVQDTTVSPSWVAAAGFPNTAVSPHPPPMRSAATFGRNGFIAVGEYAQVWVTDPDVPTDPPAINPGFNINSWSRIDLHTVGMLAPGENPNLYGVARVGDAEVIVGEDLTVIVYRPQPPTWNPRGETWNPWTRINLGALAPRHPNSVQSPALRAVAVDEVQEIIRPDPRWEAPQDTDIDTDTVPAPDPDPDTFLDSDGWVLAVGDDGAAYRFRIHLARKDAGKLNGPTVGAILDDDPTLPGPPLQVLERTSEGLNANTYDTDNDGYYDGDFYAVAADERTRMIVGNNNKVFTFPRYATFNDRLMLDKQPTLPATVQPSSVVWRGVASDDVTWMLVGKGVLSNNTPVGVYWYGEAQVERCRVLANPSSPTVAFSLVDCDTDPTTPVVEPLPSTDSEGYTVTDARVSLSDAGEPEHHDEVTKIDGPPGPAPGTFELEFDPDTDVKLQVWKLNLDRSGQQVEVLLTPDLGGPQSSYTQYVEDFVFNRGQNTFPSGDPAVLSDGHIRDVITTDVFTGVHVSGATIAESPPSPASPPYAASGEPGACPTASRDQWLGASANNLHGYLETNLGSLIAGFSRFRSADGHAYLDSYEASHQGDAHRYQSMKHYVYGRCRKAACDGGSGCADLTWTTECCEGDPMSPKADFVDLFAPYDALVVQLRNPAEYSNSGFTYPPSEPADTELVSNHADDWPAYTVGNQAGGRACSFFDGAATFADITRDEGRLALFLEAGDARDHRVAVVFDHVETCLDLSTGPVHVFAGNRVAHFMTHGETEVALWVNDRDGRWRAMSYFDELPNTLYDDVYAVPPYNFAPRAGPTLDNSPVIPLAQRDQCPIHPETLPSTQKEHPDKPKSLFDCLVTIPWQTQPFACTCPVDFIWGDQMHLSTNSFPVSP